MYILSILLLILTAILGVFALAAPAPLCVPAIITGLIGALLFVAAGRAQQREREDARTQAIVDAIRRGRP